MGNIVTELTRQRTLSKVVLLNEESPSPETVLHFVFGEHTSIQDIGMVPLVQINDTDFFLSWGVVAFVKAVYDSSDVPIQNWELLLNGSVVVDGLEKTYSFLRFPKDDTGAVSFTGDVSVQCGGITAVGSTINSVIGVLKSPDTQLQWFFEWNNTIEQVSLVFSDLVDNGTWLEFQNEISYRNIQTAGIILKDQSLDIHAADILEYLFFVKPESGRLFFYTEQTQVSQYPKAFINMDELGKDDAVAEISIKNIRNTIRTTFNYNYKTQKYEQSSNQVINQNSIDLYDKKEFVIPWKWGRQEATALEISRYVLARLKDAQIVITGTYPQHFLSNIQYNDTVAVTNTRFPSIKGEPFVNALCIVKNASLNYQNSSISYKLLFSYSYLTNNKRIGATPLYFTLYASVGVSYIRVIETVIEDGVTSGGLLSSITSGMWVRYVESQTFYEVQIDTVTLATVGGVSWAELTFVSNPPYVLSVSPTKQVYIFPDTYGTYMGEGLLSTGGTHDDTLHTVIL